MPITNHWLDAEHSIIKQDYEGHWAWDEFFASADDGRALAKSVDHRVDYILDMRKGVIPRSGSTLTNSRAVMSRRAPNAGIFVILTTPFVKTMLNVFKNFDREHGAIMFAAGTPEEAQAIIAKHRQKVATQV
jgi:hypothetical protein